MKIKTIIIKEMSHELWSKSTVGFYKNKEWKSTEFKKENNLNLFPWFCIIRWTTFPTSPLSLPVSLWREESGRRNRGRRRRRGGVWERMHGIHFLFCSSPRVSERGVRVIASLNTDLNMMKERWLLCPPDGLFFSPGGPRRSGGSTMAEPLLKRTFSRLRGKDRSRRKTDPKLSGEQTSCVQSKS